MPSKPPILPGDDGYALKKFKSRIGGQKDTPPAPEGAGAPNPEVVAPEIEGIMSEIGIPPIDAETEPAPAPEAEPTPEAEGDAGMQAIADAAGVDLAYAKKLYDAAQALEDLSGMSPEQLAERLQRDFSLRMRLEKSMNESGAKAPEPSPEPTPEAQPAGGPMAGSPEEGM